jgi:hypothetical protein
MATLALRFAAVLMSGTLGLFALHGLQPAVGRPSASRDAATADLVTAVAVHSFDSRDASDGTASAVLHRIEPDPNSGDAVVVFALDRPGIVDVDVFDTEGHLVATLSRQQPLETGKHRLTWRATPGAPTAQGLYFVRIRTEAGEWRQALVRVR